MTSTWKEPSGRGDGPDSRYVDSDRHLNSERHFGSERAVRQDAPVDENQLDLFEIFPPVTTGPARPSMPRGGDTRSFVGVPRVKSLPADMLPTDVRPLQPSTGALDSGDVKAVVNTATKRDYLDVGETDDMRRLEDSIRWLISAGSAPMPQTKPLPPVLGLAPLGARDDDSLLLDPDMLFPPRPARRRSHLAAGAAKVLLVSAVAAPSAYFVASWMQVPGSPGDTAAVTASAMPAMLSGGQTAAAPGPVQILQTSSVQIPSIQAPQAQAVPAPQTVAIAPQQADPPAANEPAPAPRSVNTAEITPAPDPEPASQPAGRTTAAIVVAAAVPTADAAPEQQPAAGATPSTDAGAPPPSAQPPKSALRPQEIAMMVEKGRVLFEAGDLAAARLFFRRAANAGDSTAAIAMGATYDPEVLAQRFIRGIEGNAEEAQRWYEKAREMGQHVEMLAQQQH